MTLMLYDRERWGLVGLTSGVVSSARVHGVASGPEAG
jgi:hypothetical protein